MTQQQRNSPSAHIPALSGILGSDNFPNGERAALKRMALDGPAPLAFHRFVLRHIDEKWQTESWQPDWRTIICALAIQRDGGFDPGTPLGKALAQAGFSENRLERLLASRGDTLRTLALRAARQLAAKGISTDWRQLADLLFCRDVEIRERLNRRIAGDYYRAVQQQEREE